MRHKVIFILVSIWLLGSFCVELFDFIGSLETYHVRIPGASAVGCVAFVGFAAWVGLIFRRKWGVVLFNSYLFMLAFFTIQDIVDGTYVGYSVSALIVIVVLGILLSRYANRHTGLPWKPVPKHSEKYESENEVYGVYSDRSPHSQVQSHSEG